MTKPQLPPLPTPADAENMVLDDDVVGVVVTSYNQPEYIGAAVASVAAQTWRRVRCVVVDDESSDDGRAAVKSVTALTAEQQKRFDVLRIVNQGPSGARNAGMEALPSDCRWVLFLDGDDMLLPDALTVLRGAVGDAPACAGLALPMGESGQIIARPDWWTMTLPNTLEADCFRARWPLVTPSTTIWRMDALRRVGGWPDVLRGPQGEDLRGEDVMLACRVAHEVAPLATTNTTTMLYRIHGEGYCADVPRLQQAIGAIQAVIADYLGPEAH